jgi:hypothetical protein
MGGVELGASHPEKDMRQSLDRGAAAGVGAEAALCKLVVD